MRLIRFPVLFIFLLWYQTASAFIPPLTAMIRDVFEARKPAVASEARLKHRVEISPGQFVELEERIFKEKSETLFLWRQVGQNAILAGRLEGQNYFLAKDKALPTASILIVNYLLLTSADTFRDLLLNEQFIRRDQLYQFRPGFMPQGDPQTWNLKENYFRHDDMYLTRFSGGVAVVVQGLNDSGNVRSVSFDRAEKGLVALQWKQGDQTVEWDLDQFSGKPTEGYYPRRLTFGRNGTTVVQSELFGVRKINDKQIYEFRQTWKQASKTYTESPALENALKILLSYR